MDILSRSRYVASAMLLMAVAVASPGGLAQTPQEQDAARRLQQNDPNDERLRMNDAARRMQQNDPSGQQGSGMQGQGATGRYPGGSAAMAGRPRVQVDATAATAGAGDVAPRSMSARAARSQGSASAELTVRLFGRLMLDPFPRRLRKCLGIIVALSFARRVFRLLDPARQPACHPAADCLGNCRTTRAFPDARTDCQHVARVGEYGRAGAAPVRDLHASRL